MYKLIIGNVRVTVNDDDIKREQAATYAKQAIAAAGQHGKLLSHVELTAGEDGVEVSTIERKGFRSVRKTIKQSMLDGICSAAKEKLYPSGTFSQKDEWFDGDTGQEWRGTEVDTAKSEVLAKLEEWAKTVYSSN